jgi:hypothetical protein
MLFIRYTKILSTSKKEKKECYKLNCDMPHAYKIHQDFKNAKIRGSAF